MAKTPVAIGVFLCERVIVEEGTRNITLVNCFRERRVDQFPSEVAEFSLFALLTDGAGEMPLVVSIQRLDTLDEIYRLASTVKFASPLREYWCRPTIQKSFPVPGHYQASLLANNEVIAQRAFAVLAKKGAS
jgi:hypothetical protein